MSQAKPVVAQSEPFKVELEEGKQYWWCACGRSAKQPFCDGSHKDTGIEPLAFTAERTGDAWLCGCKATGKAPMCDGSHKDV